MNIVGIKKTTLLDYPDKVSTTLFTYGCNMRCPYCHNKQIAFDFVGEKILIPIDKIFSIIEERLAFIDGITISGGEPSLQNGLYNFCKSIKEKYKLDIKLDTNGSIPMVVKRLIDDKLIDYVALDIKTSFKRYKELLGVDGEIIYKTYEIIKSSNIPYELRMTAYPGFINKETIKDLSLILSKNDYIYIQKCNVEYCDDMTPYEDEELKELENIFNFQGFKNVSIRGLD